MRSVHDRTRLAFWESTEKIWRFVKMIVLLFPGNGCNSSRMMGEAKRGLAGKFARYWRERKIPPLYPIVSKGARIKIDWNGSNVRLPIKANPRGK